MCVCACVCVRVCVCACMRAYVRSSIGNISIRSGEHDCCICPGVDDTISVWYSRKRPDIPERHGRTHALWYMAQQYFQHSNLCKLPSCSRMSCIRSLSYLTLNCRLQWALLQLAQVVQVYTTQHMVAVRRPIVLIFSRSLFLLSLVLLILLRFHGPWPIRHLFLAIFVVVVGGGVVDDVVVGGGGCVSFCFW